MSFFRDHIFFAIDKALPRTVARMPYDLAFETLQKSVQNIDRAEIWTRNSFKKGNYIFGVSDLDLTISLPDENSKKDLSKILRILQEAKSAFPFIGETNFIIEQKLPMFVSSLNAYERLRDPILNERLGASKNSDIEIDKIAFLLRMVFSDYYKLKRFPHLRQKKWKEHFRMMNLEHDKLITTDDVIQAIVHIGKFDPVLFKETIQPIKSPLLSDEKIFRSEMPAHWRFLYPHKHLWFDRGEETSLLELRNSIWGQVCLQQIRWEMWGLMTQFPFLKENEEGLRKHIGRLVKVAEIIRPGTDIPAQSDEILKAVASL